MSYVYDPTISPAQDYLNFLNSVIFDKYPSSSEEQEAEKEMEQDTEDE